MILNNVVTLKPHLFPHAAGSTIDGSWAAVVRIGGVRRRQGGGVLEGRGGYGSGYGVIAVKQNGEHMRLSIPGARSALLILAGIPLLMSITLTGNAQTLRWPIPACHLLPDYTPGNTECFDDVDRNGKFSSNRGDRAFTLKLWREYQLNSTY